MSPGSAIDCRRCAVLTVSPVTEKAFDIACAHAAGNHRSGVHADMQGKRQADAVAPPLGDARHPAGHFERAVQGPFRVVFMRLRCAEQGKQGIADKLVDKPAERREPRRQFLEQFVLQRLKQFRVGLLAQRGEVAKIGEEHRNSAPVGIGVGLPRRLSTGSGKGPPSTGYPG